MNFSIVSKGVAFTLICDFILAYFLMAYNFELKPITFTGWLVAILFVNTFFAGRATKKYPEIHGMFIAVFSAFILFMLVSLFVPLNWELNFHISVIWSLFGFLGGLAGSVVKVKKVRFMRRNKVV